MEKTKVVTKYGDLPHIAVKEFAQLEGQDLREVVLSPNVTSCTRFIHAVEFTYNEDDYDEPQYVILCDTPGLMDSRGEEVDVANQFGVAKAAKECRSVVPLILLSKADMGDRLNGLRELVRVMSGMFTNFEESQNSLQFLFSMYPDTDEERKNLKRDIKEGKLYMNDKDKQNPNFMLFYDRLAAATSNLKNTNIISPLQPSTRDNLMAAII
jgi:hypothetical protein